MPDDPKATLHHYLCTGREAMTWKLTGLSDHDMRRPMTPTGTNLLGLVKHLASVELGYFGDCFGRPSGIELPWFADDAPPNADMYATADESHGMIVDLYERAWRHSDATIEALDLDSEGSVPWWSPERRVVSLHRILVHVATETHRHAGHADILRESIDGEVGMRSEATNVPFSDPERWAEHRATVQAEADRFAGS